MQIFKHSYPFDPSYGYNFERLLAIAPPVPPEDFAMFWQHRYQQTLTLNPSPKLLPTGVHQHGYEVFDLYYQTTDNLTIGGWLLVPEQQPIQRGIVVGHGYGGRDTPDDHLGIANTVLLFPCFRGLSRSRCAGVSEEPQYHVLHDLDQRNQYILGGCVEDLWLAVTALLHLFPQCAGHIGYMGISFGGGIGALGVPWDHRVQKLHINVPSFGHHPLRLQFPTYGSAAAVQAYTSQHGYGHVLAILQYYDAAVAATFAQQPLHAALAFFDPAVAPPGQYAIYNAWAGPKQLFQLEAGHFEYPNRAQQEQYLLHSIQHFFSDL